MSRRAAVVAVVLLAACSGEISPTDAHQATDQPLAPDVVGACSASSCGAGCCEGAACRLWSSGACGATGTAGEPCVDCAGTCEQGRCVTDPGACGPSNCEGCCEGDDCLGGTTLATCGKGGVPCEMCVPPKRCTTGVCK